MRDPNNLLPASIYQLPTIIHILCWAFCLLYLLQFTQPPTVVDISISIFYWQGTWALEVLRYLSKVSQLNLHVVYLASKSTLFKHYVQVYLNNMDLSRKKCTYVMDQDAPK
jgi:hypothetical protein